MALATSRLTDDSRQRIAALLAVTDDAIAPVDADADGARVALGMIKEAPGSVSLDTMLTEIDKLLAVRAIGLDVSCESASVRSPTRSSIS